MLKYTLVVLGFLFVIPLQAQTKKIKRPKNRVGISSVDSFVRESFDLYDKVYMYDGYAAAGKSLEDEDIDVLEDALEDVSALSADAPDIISDLDGEGALKQGKAVLQMNRAKKALKYSIKTTKALLLGARSEQESSEEHQGEGTTPEEDNSDSTSSSSENTTSDNTTSQNTASTSTVFKVNSKFDFVPGDELIFFEDFSADFIGDFPSKWNTNGSGEVVTLNDAEQRWLEMIPGYNILYIPMMDALPEEYTIEFDVVTSGLTNQTSSGARLNVTLSDNSNFNTSSYKAQVSIPFGQYSAFNIDVVNYLNGGNGAINSDIKADIRKIVKGTPHFSIAVNKERLRFWINERKYVDIPKLIPAGKLNTLKFNLYGFEDNKERLFITNLKIAKGGLDLRRTLMSTGKVSTTGILFDSGSATIQPQSYGILRQISQVLQQDKNMKLQIVGHTDSDGDASSNLTLSRKRAASIKTALEQTYDIASSRLMTDGKGASEPVASNDTPDGKAKNRRVQFIKQ